MNYIDKVTILKFWGEKKVVIKFQPKENFLIGVNGSGKTTVINLIAAAIEADFTTLDRIDFEKITVDLISTEDKKNKSKIVVWKQENEKTPYQNILFEIYKGKEKYFDIYLDDLEEDRIIRKRSLYQTSFKLYPNNPKKDLQLELKRLFNTSWLSIHRYKPNFRRIEEKNFESLVDQKLAEFSTNLSGYLNELNRKAKDETDKFQKYIFLSLLSAESEDQLFKTVRKIDIDKEKRSLAEVYSLFKLDSSEYQENLDKYANTFKIALENAENDKISFIDAEYLIGMQRIHSVIQKWQELLHKQEVIFESRNNFMTVINDLLQRKELSLNIRNELQVETQSGKIFPLSNLSSGEKQLLIIFGETLLQRSEPHIFIADEPELSLHVEWQEKLVQGLKILNPYSQMIFATHSPDIVGKYQNSVINIENCIS